MKIFRPIISLLLLLTLLTQSMQSANSAGTLCPNMMDMPMEMASHPNHALGNGTTLNEMGYKLNIVTSPTVKNKTFKFNISQNNSKIENFTLDMGKLLHLIVYSSDFKEYYHIHPKIDSKLDFTAQVPLTRDTNYRFVVDFALPINDKKNPVAQLILGGEFKSNSSSLKISKLTPKCVFKSNGYTFQLSKTTLPLEHDTLMINIFDGKGNPVVFDKYLNADAHLVVINTRNNVYSHFHPMNSDGTMPVMYTDKVSLKNKNINNFTDNPSADIKTAKNPSVGMLHFMTEPPGAGTYVAYLQFVDKGKLITTSFIFIGK